MKLEISPVTFYFNIETFSIMNFDFMETFDFYKGCHIDGYDTARTLGRDTNAEVENKGVKKSE